MRTPRTHGKGRIAVVLLLAGALVLAACGSSDSGSSGSSSKALTVGAKNFAGAQLVSQLYAQTLSDHGYDITFKDNIGPTETVYPLLKKGDIDLYAEFSGTFALTELNKNATANSAQNFQIVKQNLPSDIVAIGPASAQDVNGFYVLKSTADKYNLKTVSDLKAVAPQLVFGGPPECLERDPCLGPKSQALYGLQFKEVKKLDAGGAVTNADLDDGTIDVAILFTGSSLIKPDYVLLKDDKGLQPADNPIALVRKDVNSAELDRLITSVNDKLDTKAYNEMTLKVQNDKEDPEQVAKAWLQQEGLIKK